MYIAIYEHEEAFINFLLSAIEEWAQTQGHYDIHVKVFVSVEAFWEAMESAQVLDIFFLDVDFPGISGFTLAKKIRELDLRVPLVLMASGNHYAVQGYELSVYRYLQKPVTPQQLSVCLDYGYRCCTADAGKSFLIVRKGYAQRLPYHDVLCLCTAIHSVTIRTTHGRDYTFPLKTTFENYAAQFPADQFIRCHRGFIVNLRHVIKYSYRELTLTGGITIPIGRVFSETVLARLKEYLSDDIQI